VERVIMGTACAFNATASAAAATVVVAASSSIVRDGQVHQQSGAVHGQVLPPRRHVGAWWLVGRRRQLWMEC